MLKNNSYSKTSILIRLAAFFISNSQKRKEFRHKFRNNNSKVWQLQISKLLKVKIKEFVGKIYVIGDSHTNVFSGAELIKPYKDLGIEVETRGPNLLPIFETFHLGPCLAYNAPKFNTSVKCIEKTEVIIKKKLIPPESIILLSFGEIDCRVHVQKQAESQNVAVEKVIDSILSNYQIYIEWLQKKGFKVICWGPVATQSDDICVSAFPRYGTMVERNKITELFNNKLKLLCDKLNCRFCSIFSELVDKNFKTKLGYISADGCHLSQTAMPLIMKEMLKSVILTFENGILAVNENFYEK